MVGGGSSRTCLLPAVCGETVTLGSESIQLLGKSISKKFDDSKLINIFL